MSLVVELALFVELYAGMRNLQLVHVLGVGEGELAGEVAPLALLHYASLCLGAVARDVGKDVPYVDAASGCAGSMVR